MHRNHQLISILILLVLTSIVLSFLGNNQSTTEFSVDIFSVADTSAIQSITIQNEGLVKLEKTSPGLWMVNDQFKVDASLQRVLLAVLNQVNVKRPVSQIQREEIATVLKNGTRV